MFFVTISIATTVKLKNKCITFGVLLKLSSVIKNIQFALHTELKKSLQFYFNATETSLQY